MSTPPNPPGPPAEPEGTPAPQPEAAPTPTRSPDKSADTPAADATPKPEATPDRPEPDDATRPLSLTKTPAPAAEPSPTAPADAAAEPAPPAEQPDRPEHTEPTPLSLTKLPEPEPTRTPAPEPQPAPAPEAAPAAATVEVPAAPAAEPVPAAEPAPAAAAGAPDTWAAPARGSAPAPESAPTAAYAAQHGFAAPSPDTAAMPGYGVPGGPVPPQAGLWAAPGAGGPWFQQPAPVTNGLAVAALVVGLVSLPVGPLPFLFWLGAILGVTAVGLGIGAVNRASAGAGRKTMSVIGTVLGVLGIAASVGGYFVTQNVVDRLADRAAEARFDDPDRYDDHDPGADEPWPPNPSAAPKLPAPKPSRSAPPTGPGMTTPLPFGETYTYPNGIKVSLSAPKEYVSKNRYSTVRNAVQITMTITNGSTENHNVIHAVPEVRDDKGMTAQLAFDGGDMPRFIRGDILPGQSASGIITYEVPEGTTGLSASISPGILMPGAKFAGPIG
ncbi:DUF4352 domain-containing protein [Streptomyces sp. NPDC090445]|uniref:DUF4190 domain-containing protein n=1 Tax=Streptomyces sp. NPDC090445 TaxID=3365963 RepID=UPI0038307AF6